MSTTHEHLAFEDKLIELCGLSDLRVLSLEVRVQPEKAPLIVAEIAPPVDRVDPVNTAEPIVEEFIVISKTELESLKAAQL